MLSTEPLTAPALDPDDTLTEWLLDTLVDQLSSARQPLAPLAVLFWPLPQFAELLRRWPELGEAYSHTWDEYRTNLERGMILYAESGRTQLSLLAGSADELATYAAHLRGDPTDPRIRQSYAEHLDEHPHETAWPPGRNETCWCGSGIKYKKCCLPRSRR
jgi:hypothetical protein